MQRVMLEKAHISVHVSQKDSSGCLEVSQRVRPQLALVNYGRGESCVLETKLVLFDTHVGGLLSWPMASVLDSGLPFRCSQVKVSFHPAQVILSKGWWLQGPGQVHLVEIIPVAKSRLTLCNPMDCSPPGSSVHEISQASILEWVVVSFSRESF